MARNNNLTRYNLQYFPLYNLTISPELTMTIMKMYID